MWADRLGTPICHPGQKPVTTPATRIPRPSRGSISRRAFLAGAGGIATGLAIATTGCTPNQTTFTPTGTAPLPIPPLAPSELLDGRRRFTLTAASGETELVTGRPDIRTATMGYDGTFLGPTLRSRRGENVSLNVHNALTEATTLHWHGMHLPAAMDGGPHTPIPAGASATAQWEVKQPAATLWYHPHPHGQTEAQVLAGLAGIFIIDDDASDASGLPHGYGIDDLPMVLQDRFLDSNGQIIRATDDNALGTIGNTLLANGLAGTHFEVTTELLRLRLLNGCTARFLDLHLGDERTFTLIGTDGALLNEPVELDHLLLSPGERAEILIHFQPGDKVALGTRRPDIPGGDASVTDMTPGVFTEFRAAEVLTPAADWQLPPDQRPALAESQAARTRTMELKTPFLNGKLMDMERIDAIVKAGDIEVWEVSTRDPFPHNFHIHDVQFRILDINGNPPPAHLSGWKDNIPVLPEEKTRLIMRFEDYTDNAIPYMMHCHLLRHEDQGMMGQFLITANGTGPDRITAND